LVKNIAPITAGSGKNYNCWELGSNPICIDYSKLIFHTFGSKSKTKMPKTLTRILLNEIPLLTVEK
jgi:hypothetical protein